jgi:hypothetical protein
MPEQENSKQAIDDNAARRIANGLDWLAGAVAAWGFFYPRPYALAMTANAVLPLAAIAMLVRSKGAYQIGGQRADPRPSLAIAFVLPAVVLAFRAVEDADFLAWTRLLAPALALGVAVWLAAVYSDGTLRRGITGAAMLVFCVVYIWGGLAQADVLLDRSAPQIFQAMVLGERSSRSRGRTNYELWLAPWGAQTSGSRVSVPRRIYDSVAAGNKVCVVLQGGALRVPWYRIDPCP